MNSSYLPRPASRLLFAIFLLTALLLIAACQPIVDPALLEEQSSASPEAIFEVEPAKATVDTAALRVRQGPGDQYDRVAGVQQGESYEVLAMTSDGAWIQLAVDDAPDGSGWVSTEFVTLEGDITNIATVPAEGAEAEAATDAGDSTGTADTAESSEDVDTGSEDQAALDAVGQALIQTPLPLRVRSEPDDTVDNKIGSVYNLEEYPVLDISDDGNWVLIDVPRLSDTGGWVWWENVVISGAIADQFAQLTGGVNENGDAVVAGSEATPDATETPEAAATETADTAAAEEEVAAEPTPEPAEEAASEAVETETETATATETPAEEPQAGSTTEPPAGAIGEALIQTPLPLRVRSAPDDTVDNKIGNVFDGESYPVLEISEDGLWIKIYVPDLADDGGWVSAEYALLSQ